VKKLLVLVLLLGGCGYAGSQGYSWWDEQVNRPVSSTSRPVMVHVAEVESPDQLGQDLRSKGLIRDTSAFNWYARYSGAGSRFQAGDFGLDQDMSMAAMVAALEHARPATIRLLLPEGSTLKEMAAAAQKAGVGDQAGYVSAASDLHRSYPFLADRPAGAPGNLEGFLFPDTYEVPTSSTSADLVKLQLDRFDQVLTPDMRDEAARPVSGRPAETVYNVITLASIVEREANREADRPVVCGIFYNRLAQGIPLGADATVQYAVGHAALTDVDLRSTSPYNTRLHAGLPPGPISNPGLASIMACLEPRPSQYLFYFTDRQGVTRFQRTLAEFNQQQAQYGLR
jgi:UPF0755 protein